MTTTIKTMVEILNFPASGSPLAQWQDVTTDVTSVEIVGHGLLGPRSPNANLTTARFELNNNSGTYAFSNIPTSPVTMKYPWLEPGNRVRMKEVGALGKCLQVKPATGSPTIAQTVTGSWSLADNYNLSWYARATSDSKYNTDSVSLVDNGTTNTTQAFTYTNKWVQYSITGSVVPSATSVTGTFRPNGTLNTSAKPYAYIEYKNISLTVNGGANLLTNGDFATGTTSGWTISGYSPTVIDDYYIVFQGFIDQPSRNPGAYADRKVMVPCVSYLARFGDQSGRGQRIDLPIQRSVTTDQLVTTILKYADDNPAGSWIQTARRLGPRRWYRMGESSGTAATDSGLDGLPAAYVNSPTLAASSGLTNGDADTAVTFLNTSSQYVNVPTFDFVTPKSWTISAWVKFDSTGPSDQTFFGAYYSTASGWKSIDLWSFTGNQIVAGFPHVSAPYYYSSGVGSMSANTWTLATVVFDGSANTVKIYVNGVLKTTGAISALTMTSPTCTIGQNGNSAYYWRGGIDEVMIFDKPLSDQDVLDLYNSSLFDDQVWLSWFPGVKIETSKQTYAVALNGYITSASTVSDALNQAAISEYGRFWVDRDGTFQFHMRDHWFTWQYARAQGTRKTLDLTSSSMPFDSTETYVKDALTNRVIVSYTPRVVTSGSPVVLGQITNVITLPPLVSGSLTDTNGAVPSRTQVTVNFRDSTGNVIGGTGLVLPLVAGTDFQVYDTPDTTGTDYSSSKYIGVSLVSLSASQATFEVRNYGIGNGYLLKLQARGYAVNAYDTQLISAFDAASRKKYGTMPYTKVLPFTDNATFATAMANYFLYRYKAPFIETSQVSFANVMQPNSTDLLQFEVGDVVKDKGSRYHEITGIHYSRQPGNAALTTFILSRFDSGTYGTFDDGVTKFDDGTVFTL